ncbi:hypothetical protein GCM10009116_10060 [Brevundimonas basaltis]|uniref:AICAR transformylase/IMP cyclohydrolase PurH n=1 Tax=Brevundimonas basaltis TaxID=472166 RepID=A0A7W8HYC1_9CAUL|nr:AICAR transformylase/IMP cyclohydrolase PurH [Brevundimonas basaltis]
MATRRRSISSSARSTTERGGRALNWWACASEAFFPFADGLIEAVAAGATAIIQPGGSIRDDEVIAAADRQGVAMALTAGGCSGTDRMAKP